MKLSREEAIRELESLGVKVSGSVSANTDLLLMGEAPGQKKQQAARVKGVPIMRWEYFRALGFGEHRQPFRLDLVLEEALKSLLLITATLSEEIYAQAIRRPTEPRLFRAHQRTSLAVNYLLQAGYGSTPGDDPLRTKRGDESPSGAAFLDAGILNLCLAVIELNGVPGTDAESHV